MDDVLVFGATWEQHDLNLMAVLKQLEAAGVTLNPAKCEFSKASVKLLEHLLDKIGISADLNKTEAILHMDAPQSVSDLRRLSQPLRELLSPKNVWICGPEQEREFSKSRMNLLNPLC